MNIFTMPQFMAHLIGDHILQPRILAVRKMREFRTAIFQSVIYSLPFLLFEPSTEAWLVIVITHAIIDRYAVAKYLNWLKNLNLKQKITKTGYPSSTPEHLSSWACIVTDGILHLTINALALAYL